MSCFPCAGSKSITTDRYSFEGCCARVEAFLQNEDSIFCISGKIDV